MGRASTERGVNLREDPTDGSSTMCYLRREALLMVAMGYPSPPGKNVLESMSPSRAQVMNYSPGPRLRLPGV